MDVAVGLAAPSYLPEKMTLRTIIVGNDIRKAIYDGFPRDKVIAADIHPGTFTLL